MKLIETKTLTVAAASIAFTSIPQTFTDLVLVFSLRSNTSTGEYAVGSFNSTTTGYAVRNIRGEGSGAITTTPYTSGTNARIFTYAVGNDATANTYCNSQMYITNYAGSANKAYSSEGVMENNAILSVQEIQAGLWSNTAAITSITITPLFATNWLATSQISLYGVTSGSDSIVTVA